MNEQTPLGLAAYPLNLSFPISSWWVLLGAPGSHKSVNRGSVNTHTECAHHRSQQKQPVTPVTDFPGQSQPALAGKQFIALLKVQENFWLHLTLSRAWQIQNLIVQRLEDKSI